MTRLIGAEMLKLRKRGMTWILLYILAGITILLHFVLYAISRISLPSTTPGEMTSLQNLLGLPLALPFGLSILAGLGAVLAVILMASSTGSEYNWRTIRLALISSESRGRFLAAKVISAGIIILIGMVAGLATSFIMSLITTAIGGNSFDFAFMTGSYLWAQFVQFWRTFFVIFSFSMLGFFFSILGRSAMPGIAVGIGILFLDPFISSFMRLAGGWVSSIPNYLFAANANAINALNQLPGRFSGGTGFGGLSVELPSVPHAFIVLGVYMLVFLAAGFYLFHKRDVTG